ncbi:hypothetical protein AAC387_Pa05g3902 [Persea americana]
MTGPSSPTSPLFGTAFSSMAAMTTNPLFGAGASSFTSSSQACSTSSTISSSTQLVASSVTSSSPSFFFGTPSSYGFPSSFGFGNAASSSSSTPDVVLESVKLGKEPELPGEAEEVAATDAKADFADEDEEEDVAPKTRAEKVDTAEAEACEENNAGTDEGGLNEILLNIYSVCFYFQASTSDILAFCD